MCVNKRDDPWGASPEISKQRALWKDKETLLCFGRADQCNKKIHKVQVGKCFQKIRQNRESQEEGWIDAHNYSG